MTKAQDLDQLFSPNSIAIIGASNDAGKGGGFILSGLLLGGFKGELYPVNPKQSEVMGLTTYPSILDIPGEVDAAVVAVAARIVPRVMAECSQKGVKFAVVHSAGFAELGAEGRELEKEMLLIARQGGTRLVGPNCMGLYNPGAGLNTILVESELNNEPGSIAFVGQSGNVTENFIYRGYELGLRFSKVVSIGNQSDLTIEDLIEYFAADPQTKIMGCYIEGLKRGREFLQLAKQISPRKPIVAWKGGKSEAGTRLTATHTASLASNSAVFDTALKQGGVTAANNIEEVLDLVTGFTSPFLPAGNRVGLIAEAGSGAVTGADVAEEVGLKIPVLSAKAQKEIAEVLADEAMPSLTRQNPVDLGWLDYEPAARLCLECSRVVFKEVDAIVALSYAHLDEDFARQLVSLRDEMKKPILIVAGLPSIERQGMNLLVRNGIPTYTILARALKVLAAMVRYADYRQQG